MPQATHCRKSSVSLYKEKHKRKIVEAIKKFMPRDFKVSLSPKRDKGVRPINSLKVSLNGSLLGSVIMPSLIPLMGSLMKVKVINESKIPGSPTPIKAACQPLSPKGAWVGSG